jgi:hypothetical protein
VRAFELPALKYLLNLVESEVVPAGMIADFSLQRETVSVLLELEEQPLRKFVGGALSIGVEFFHVNLDGATLEKQQLFRGAISLLTLTETKLGKWDEVHIVSGADSTDILTDLYQSVGLPQRRDEP